VASERLMDFNMKCDLCKLEKVGVVRIGIPDGTLVVCKECAADVYINEVNPNPTQRDTLGGRKDKRSRKSVRGGE
jgi:ribosome-binding protein aMBF1 (putative translation factor)